VKILYTSILFFVFLVQPLFSQDLQGALNELTKNYDECLQRLEKRDSLINMMNDALKTSREIRSNTDSVMINVSQLMLRNKALVYKYEKMQTMSDSISFLLKKNLALSQTSVNDLDNALVKLNKKYNTAVKDCIRPWYKRWELYGGAVLGAVLGWQLRGK